MKKIFLIAAVLVMGAMTANAQKGDWYLGGSVGFNYSDDTDFVGGEKTTSFSIMPNINYMFADKWSVGLGIGFNYIKNKEADTKANLFNFRPNVAYHCQLSEKFFYTPSVFINVGFGEDTKKRDVTVFGGGVNPLCFEFKPTASIGLTISAGDLSYTTTNVDDGNNDGNVNEFNFNFNSNFQFGFNYYF